MSGKWATEVLLQHHFYTVLEIYHLCKYFADIKDQWFWERTWLHQLSCSFQTTMHQIEPWKKGCNRWEDLYDVAELTLIWHFALMCFSETWRKLWALALQAGKLLFILHVSACHFEKLVLHCCNFTWKSCLLQHFSKITQHKVEFLSYLYLYRHSQSLCIPEILKLTQAQTERWGESKDYSHVWIFPFPDSMV